MVCRRLTLNIVHSQTVALPLLNVRQFRFRIELFPGELLRTLQRREGVVGPYSLKVGLAIGRTWRSPGLLAGGRQSHEHQRNYRSENALSHWAPPLRAVNSASVRKVMMPIWLERYTGTITCNFPSCSSSEMWRIS